MAKYTGAVGLIAIVLAAFLFSTKRSAIQKRVVVWGTGVVGSMVIAEILDHPVFELVGVGVTRSERAGQDVGTLMGLGETGILTTTP